MLQLRLFHRDDPSRQVDSRQLGEGELVIGRDAKADWPVADPDRGISRRHLVIASHGGLVTLRDTSSNGVFLGEARERVAQERAVPIGRGEAIRFGPFILVVEEYRRGDGILSQAGGANPFAGSDEGKAGSESAQHRPDPFASALKPDPLGQGGVIGDMDEWKRRREAPAGSWDAVPPHRKPEHATLIGSDRHWAEPPPPPAREDGYGFDAPFQRPILEQTPATPATTAIPSDWMEAASAPTASPEPLPAAPPLPPREAAAAPPQLPPSPDPILPAGEDAAPAAPDLPPAASPELRAAPAVSVDDAGLFEHFCAGAGLDLRHFAGEDRAAVMERLGGVYRQAVLGVTDLMRERTSLRNEYRMVHTTVRPDGNNPFKWVPPQRIAIELLRDGDGGYTTGEHALNEALRDVKAHLLCMLAGMRAALSTTFGALQPQQVEARLAARSYLVTMQRDAALWAEYVAMADALRLEADDNPDGLINRAFRQGYEEQAAALAGGGQGQWR